jgi:hypothetical protein
MGPRNRFQGMNSASLRSLTGRNDDPIPPRFLAPIDFLKIPAQVIIPTHVGCGGGCDEGTYCTCQWSGRERTVYTVYCTVLRGWIE